MPLLDSFRSLDGLLERIRLLFVVLIGYSIVGAFFHDLSRAGNDGGVSAVVYATAVALTVWAWGYYRRGRPGPVVDLLPLVIVTVQGTVAHDPTLASASLFGALFLQCMYAMSWARGALLTAGYGVALTLVNHAAGRAATSIVSDLFMFVAVAAVIQAVASTIGRHERRRERDATLTEATASLLSTRDPHAVAQRLAAGAVRLIGPGGMATLWVEKDGHLVRQAMAGQDHYALESLPVDQLPEQILAQYRSGQIIHLDAATISQLERCLFAATRSSTASSWWPARSRWTLTSTSCSPGSPTRRRWRWTWRTSMRC